MRFRLFIICALVFLAVGVNLSSHIDITTANSPVLTGGFTGMADSKSLINHYNKWRVKDFRESGEGRVMSLRLGWVRGMSADKFSSATGQVSIDLVSGQVELNTLNLPDGEWELWFINNQYSPNNSTMPDATDLTISVGTFSSKKGSGIFTTKFDTNQLDTFQIDRVVISPSGEFPYENFAITGAPRLYERMQNQLIARKYQKLSKGQRSIYGSFSNFLKVVDSTSMAMDDSSLDMLVAKGRAIFINETFGGNGRTCNTCHREDNNFTIDPKFIAKLPPTDPLFVAETNPNLANNFEKPELLRKFGLFLENVDGMEDLEKKFTLRSSSHLFALNITTKAPPLETLPPKLFLDVASLSTANPQPVERLGWSGDGSPGSGSLREFAIGAVIQHFPKSLARKAGSDFRLPTDDELDALEAFQRSIGRQEDFDLDKLRFSIPVAVTGQALFNGAAPSDGGKTKKCSVCHFGGGANAAFAVLIDPTCINCFPFGYNGTVGIATEATADVIKTLPADGGFGTENVSRSPFAPAGGFGNCSGPGKLMLPCSADFNTSPAIEAADTLPGFHTHLVATIEDVVAHYGTKEFDASIGSNFQFPVGNRLGQIKLNKKETSQIGAFLRAINALENIRSTIELQKRALATNDANQQALLINLAAREVQDAIDDLVGGAFATDKSPTLALTLSKLKATSGALKNALTQPISVRKAILGGTIVNSRSARNVLASEETLPNSYKN
jgi:cytochrome c peroxidase